MTRTKNDELKDTFASFNKQRGDIKIQERKQNKREPRRRKADVEIGNLLP